MEKDIKFIGLEKLSDICKKVSIEYLEARLMSGFLKVAKKKGIPIDEEIYNCSLSDFAECYLEMKFSTFILISFGVWNYRIEKAIWEIIIMGTGDCPECGGDLELESKGVDGELDYLKCDWCKKITLKNYED